MTIIINGTDITRLIAALDYKRIDIEGRNSWVTLSGTTVGDRITSKKQFVITLIPLPAESKETMLRLISSEFVSLQFLQSGIVPFEGMMKTSDVATGYMAKKGVQEIWRGISFTLTEK